MRLVKTELLKYIYKPYKIIIRRNHRLIYEYLSDLADTANSHISVKSDGKQLKIYYKAAETNLLELDSNKYMFSNNETVLDALDKGIVSYSYENDINIYTVVVRRTKNLATSTLLIKL